MSRWIDADALKEYIGSVRAEFNFFDDDERARYEAHSKAIYLLDLYVNDAPSIDIVRCKECKYHNGEYCFRLVSKDAWDVMGSQCVITMQPDDFCSYGEWRE